LRQYLKGWREIYCLKIRTELLNKIDALDIKAKTVLLLPHEVELRNQLKWKLTKFLREEEIYWFQRSKAIKLLEGDANTKYFQLVADGRHRKTRIVQLKQDEGIIVGNDNLKRYTTKYYKGFVWTSRIKFFHHERNNKG
jgi:hypothetical protein